MTHLAARLFLPLALVSAAFVTGPQPSDLRLGVRDEALTLNGQPAFMLFVSYFDGPRSPHLREDFEYFRREVGAAGVRVFPNWLACGEDIHRPPCEAAADGLFDAETGALRPDRLQALKRLIALAADHRLVVDVTFTRDTLEPEMTFDAYRTAIVRTAEALRPQRNVLFDVQNEFDKHGFTEAQVKAIAREIEKVDPDRIVTASGTGAYTPEQAGRLAAEGGLDLITIHDPRREGRWFLDETAVDLVSRARKAAGSKRPVYFQEPTGWGSRSDDDTEAEHFRQALRAAREAGAAAWTFHQRVGFNLQRESFKARIARDPAMKAALESLSR